VRSAPYRCRRYALPRRNRTATAGRHHDAGFTLLELLVALTLLGLVMAVVFGELRFTARAWDSADARAARNAELLGVHGFLRQRFEQLYVPQQIRTADAADGPPAFDGSGHTLTFLATMPANVSQGGYYRIELSLEPGEDGEDLLVAWRPFDADEINTVANGPDNSRVLLRGVREISFAYYGATSDNVAPQWWDIWPARDAAPSLIRMDVAFADGDPRVWPELVVAPAIANAVLRLP